MRLQLALNVQDLNAAIDYYEKLFGVSVAKVKPGYANFELLEPPLKLVLFESTDVADRLNHLGVEVFDDALVDQVGERQRAAGLRVAVQDEDRCCFARLKKVISYAPDGTMWEWYNKHGDLEDFAGPAASDESPQGEAVQEVESAIESSACCTARCS